MEVRLFLIFARWQKDAVGIIPEGNFYNDGTKIGITLQDGLHPNAVGQQMLARAIIGKLNGYYYPID